MTQQKNEIALWGLKNSPLEPLLNDPGVTEIMVNGHQKVFIESGGVIKKTSVQFQSEDQLITLMQKMASLTGRILDNANPSVDARLPSGPRIHCILPPLSASGPVLTLRKHNAELLDTRELINRGFWDERVAYFLSVCIEAKLNIVISGGTGSGKTTLLNALAVFVPPHERIITIEDTLELILKNENCIRLETQIPAANRPEVTARNLIKQALRMRPDRIIVGESRGPEAFDMLMAMNTGHEGSLTTLHANSARDALRRLESMILMAGLEMPLKTVRQNVSSAIDAIVHVSRGPRGSRGIFEIIEVGGMEGDVILTQDIFKKVETSAGVDKNAKPTELKPSGMVPSFVRKIRERGVELPADFFMDTYQVKIQKKKT